MNNLSKSWNHKNLKWLSWFPHIFVNSQKNIFVFAFDVRFQLRFLSESQITQRTSMWPFFLMHLHNMSFHMIIWLEFFIAHGALHRFYLSFMKFSDMGLHRIFIWKTFLTNRTFMCNSLMDWADMFLQIKNFVEPFSIVFESVFCKNLTYTINRNVNENKVKLNNWKLTFKIIFIIIWWFDKILLHFFPWMIFLDKLEFPLVYYMLLS